MDVRAEARRQPVDDHLDDAAEGVAVLVGLVDALHHRGAGVGVEAAHLVGVEARDVVGLGHDAGRGADAAELDHVGDDPGADGLLEEVGRDPAERHAGGGLAGRGPLEDRPGLVEVVLLHAGQVGVAGPRAGQRRVAGQRLELDRVDRVGRHDLLPLGPLGVADLDGDRAALGLAVADAADQRDLVLLELHPGAAAVAEPAAGQGVGEVVGRHPDMGGQPLEDRDQGGAVGLARGEPTQHGVSLSRAYGGPDGSPGGEMAPQRRPTTTPTRAPTSMNGPNGNDVFSSDRSRRTSARPDRRAAKTRKRRRCRSPARPSRPSRARSRRGGEAHVAEAHAGGWIHHSTRKNAEHDHAADGRADEGVQVVVERPRRPSRAARPRPWTGRDHGGRQQAGVPVDDGQRDRRPGPAAAGTAADQSSPVAAPSSAPATAASHAAAAGDREVRPGGDRGRTPGGSGSGIRAISAGTSSPPMPQTQQRRAAPPAGSWLTRSA